MRFFIILSLLFLSIASQAAEVKNLTISQNEDQEIATNDLVGRSGENDADVNMSFVNIKGGCYEMGDSFGVGDKDEKPLHEVCVNDFALATQDVTIGDFRKFIAATNFKTDAEKSDGCVVWTGQKWKNEVSKNWRNPGFTQNSRHPVVCISWNDATAFADWLSKKSGKRYRLPSEAEWEYAARSGGMNYKYAWGNGTPSGNIADESAKKQFPGWTIWNGYDDNFIYTSPVGSFKPNELGLFDMTGNVWQWQGDWYGNNYYRDSPRNNPKGPPKGKLRVLRGGSWSTEPLLTRVANRNRNLPEESHNNYGFRLVISR